MDVMIIWLGIMFSILFIMKTKYFENVFLRHHGITPREERLKLGKTPIAFAGSESNNDSKEYANRTKSNIYQWLGPPDPIEHPIYLVGKSKQIVSKWYTGSHQPKRFKLIS